MAKKSMIAREHKRVKLSNKARVKRQELRDTVADMTVAYETKMKAVEQLNKRPRDESACRLQRRCQSCGRPRAVYRKFGLCRICLREATMRGDVPGLSKASW